MLPLDLRVTVFEALDQASPEELRDAVWVRQRLYQLIEEQGHFVTDIVEDYVALLVEEFCPDSVPGLS